MSKKRKYFFAFLFLLFFFGGFSKVEAKNPEGRIYSIDDYAVAGSAWDPDCPGTPVEVHVYHGEEAGVVCYAAYDCPQAGEGCFGPRTGFWCAYRHPVNASSVPKDINIAVINKCGSGDNVWLDKSQAVFVQVNHDREKNVIFVDKPGYKIGISKRFGASIVEFYNKRIDPTLNLIQSDPGASYQVAIFGADNRPVGPYPNCFGFNNLRYNPTQAGSHCGHPNGSEIRKCWADGVEVSCANLPTGTNTFTGKKLKFDVHFKNFYYPQNPDPNYSYPYQDFDDVYGLVTYTFEETYVQVDWNIWKANAAKWGYSWSQLPVAFLLQLTKFVYKKDGNVFSDGDPFQETWSGWQEWIDVNNHLDGRWVTILGFAEGIRKTASPSNFLTLAFYNQPIKGVCQQRQIKLNFLPIGVAVQNRLFFQAEITHSMKARTLIFPYKYNEILPGKSQDLAELINTYTFQGGLMPEWECNIGDFNGDGKVTVQDLEISLLKYKTNNQEADLSSDGSVNGIDFGLVNKLAGG